MNGKQLETQINQVVGKLPEPQIIPSSILVAPKSQEITTGNTNLSINGRKNTNIVKYNRIQKEQTEETSAQAPQKSVINSRTATSSAIRAKVLQQKQPRSQQAGTSEAAGKDV